MKIVIITVVNACDYFFINSPWGRAIWFDPASDIIYGREKKCVTQGNESPTERCKIARMIINIPRARKVGRGPRLYQRETGPTPRCYRGFMQKLLITESRDESVRQRVTLGRGRSQSSRSFVRTGNAANCWSYDQFGERAAWTGIGNAVIFRDRTRQIALYIETILPVPLSRASIRVRL